MNPRLVKVRWRDADDPVGGWQKLPLSGPCAKTICLSAGWLVFEDENTIGLADIHEGELESVSRIGYIPRGCIIEIVDLDTKRDWPA